MASSSRRGVSRPRAPPSSSSRSRPSRRLSPESLLAARALEEDDGHPPALRARALVGTGQLVVFAGTIAVAMAARGSPDLGPCLLAQLVLALEAVGLFALTLATGSRRGSTSGLVSPASARACSPSDSRISGGNLVGALPRGAEEAVVSWLVVVCPAVSTTGTFAGTNVFGARTSTTPSGPSRTWGAGPPHPLEALAFPAVVAAILVALAWLARRPDLACGRRAARLRSSRSCSSSVSRRARHGHLRGIFLVVLVLELVGPSGTMEFKVQLWLPGPIASRATSR